MEKRNKTVAPEAFIKAWQGAQGIEGVIKATGMNLHSAQYRARIYRKKGIKLQAFAPRRGAPKLDVAKLNKLAVASIAASKNTSKPAKKIAAKKARKRSHSKRPAKKSVKKAK